jgi:formyl-CoA transferase
MNNKTEKLEALGGLKVLECATVIAAPLCGRLLADFGAEVLHIETPIKGDHLRNFGFEIDGINPWWKTYARNKKLITLNISKEEGRKILYQLLEDTDIFIENFRPGRLEDWGINIDELQNKFPRLIIVRVTGYGQTGPYANQPGFGTLMEAMSGFAEMTGEKEGMPILPQFALADTFAGFYSALSAMFAIYNRDILKTQKGQVIDVSIWESLFSVLGPNAMVYDLTGQPPKRMGNRAPTSAPRNTYKTKDNKWIAIAGATQTTAERLFKVIGRSDLINHPKFSDNSKRVVHVNELDDYISEWMQNHTLEEASSILHKEDVPMGPVFNIEDIMNDVHAKAREMVINIFDNGKNLHTENVFPKLSKTPGKIKHLGKDMGADNEEVFKNRLGLKTDQINQLKKEGII